MGAKLRFLIFFILFLGLGFLIAVMQEPYYVATVDLMVDQGLAGNVLSRSYDSLKEFVNYQKEIILTPDLLRSIAKELHLDISQEYAGTDIVDKLLKQVKVEVVGDSLIKITARTKSANLSVSIANHLADRYLKILGEVKFSWAKKVKAWIDEEWDMVKQFNNKSEELSELTGGGGIESLFKEKEFLKNERDRLEKDKDRLNDKLKLLERESLKIRKMYNQPLYYIVVRLGNRELNQLIEAYKKKQEEIRRLSMIYTPDHPRISELEKEKDEIGKKIKETLQYILDDYKNKIKDIKVKLGKIEETIADYEKKYSDLDKKITKAVKLQGEITYLKGRIDSLKKRLDTEGYFPINVSHMRLTPEEFTPVREDYNYLPFIIAFSLLGIVIASIINYLIASRSARVTSFPKIP